MEWNRDLLVAALVADAPAENACREVLRAGLSFLPPRDRSVAVSGLVTIYERRARHLAERGIRPIGLDTAVERLRDQHGAVKLAQVHSDDFNFVIFLDPVEPAAVTCLAVAAGAADPSGTTPSGSANRPDMAAALPMVARYSSRAYNQAAELRAN